MKREKKREKRTGEEGGSVRFLPVCDGEKLILRGSYPSEDGVPLLSISCRFPAPAEENGARTRITDFYCRLAKEVSHYAETVLFPALEKEYLASEEARRRYSFPRARLVGDFRVTQAEDGWYSVRRRLVLFRGGRRLAEKEYAEVFSLARGLLCPLGYLRARGLPFATKNEVSQHTGRPLRNFWRKVFPLRPSGFYLEEREIHLLFDRELPIR